MQLCYIDTRPRGSRGIFSAEVLRNDTIQLKDIETKRTHLCPGHEFRRHYDNIWW